MALISGCGTGTEDAGAVSENEAEGQTQTGENSIMAGPYMIIIRGQRPVQRMETCSDMKWAHRALNDMVIQEAG